MLLCSPSHRKLGDNSVALRNASIPSFPAEDLPKSWEKGLGTGVKEGKKVRENK